MTTFYRSLLSIAAALVVTGSTSFAEESKAYLHNYNVPSTGVALEGYCPVAYHTVNKPVKGKRELAVMHDSVWYFLASEEAKQLFEANPKRYLPAYGGWCAFGMSVQDKFPVDPRDFKIVNGRLMLFLRNKNVDALKLWNDGNEAELASKADAHWTKVNK